MEGSLSFLCNPYVNVVPVNLETHLDNSSYIVIATLSSSTKEVFSSLVPKELKQSLSLTAEQFTTQWK